MRLKIKYKNSTLYLLCTNFRANRTSLYLYGLEDSTIMNIEALGLEFLFMANDGDIMVWTKKHLSYEIIDLRKSNSAFTLDLAAGEIFCFETGLRMNKYLGDGYYSYQTNDGELIDKIEPDTLIYPCTNLAIKQIKVRLLRIDSDNCMEIWQSEPIKGKRIYMGRDTGIGHFWHYLSDAPNGYCEPDYPVSNMVELIICDKNWKEICRDSNNKLLHGESFPSLEQLCKSKWKSIRSKYPHATKEGFADWLDSKMPDGVSYSDKINWRDFRYEIIDPDNILQETSYVKRATDPTIKTEVIDIFSFLNEDYRIIRIAKKHTLCGAIWYEYVADHSNGSGRYAAWFAYEYEINKTIINT